MALIVWEYLPIGGDSQESRTYAFCSFSLREKVGMRGSIRKNALFFNPLTLALSRRERGLKPLFGKSWLGEMGATSLTCLER